jgi:phosphoribosylanthranilate isomerase
VADIKFCGLTRREDANHATALGASFVGVIFAGGPRMITPDRAAEVLRDVPRTIRRVGVFADQADADILRTAEKADLDVLQLHSQWDPERVARLRGESGRLVWPVVRVEGANPPEWVVDAFALGDGVLLDALVPGALGGTGVALPWAQLSLKLTAFRGETPIILAGGLRPENVAVAIAALAPSVVDVSSGVESSPGIKDPDRMRAFRDAVVHASVHT